MKRLKNTAAEQAQQARVRAVAINIAIGLAYFLLCWLFRPASFGLIRIRLADMLCVLPFFVPSAVWGLSIGCLFATAFFGAGAFDVLLGTAAVCLAALLTARVKVKWLTPLPSIVVNAILQPIIMMIYTMNEHGSYWIVLALMGAGQLLACAGLGLPLLLVIERFKRQAARK